MLKKLKIFAASLLALVLAVSLSTLSSPAAPKGEPITLGYSNWAGWWPWAIAVDQKMFEKNGVNVQMKWFDGYVQSMETFAAGKIDGNSQTLNFLNIFGKKNITYYQYSRKSKSKVVITDTFKRLLLINQYYLIFKFQNLFTNPILP